MLGYMRKNARSTAIKVVFGMIIVVFCFWGVGVMVGGDRVNVAAMVDDEPITAQAYTVAYERLHRTYRDIYRENFTPQVVEQLNLEQRALDDLVTTMLLRREAVRLGFSVSDDEVRDAILNIPTFHDGGRFDRARYLATLRASRISPTEFEESQREAILISKLESLLTDGLYVGEREVDDLYALENEKIDVAFVKIPAERFEAEVEVGDADVAAYYEEHRERFRVPEKVAFAYVAYDPAALKDRLPVSDDAIEAYYETHRVEFETREQVRLRHILVAVPADDGDAARAEAATVLAELQAGADFAALAAKHSDDPLTADAGGDLGLVARGTLEGPLEEAAFALEAGGLSDVVESPRGLHILKVDEHLPAATRPLAAARAEVVRALRESGADGGARDALAEDLEKARAGATLETLAEARGLAVVAVPPTAAGEPVPDVTGGALVAGALALDEGGVGEVEGAEPPYYLVKVLGKTPSTIEPLEDERARIVDLLRKERARDQAEAEAERLLAAAREGGGVAALATAAAAAGLEVEETGPIGRTDPLTQLDRAPIIRDLFVLTAEAPVASHAYVLPKSAAAVVLKERLPADRAELTAEKRAALRSTALSRRRIQTLDAYRDMLRQRAEISVNPNVITGAV